MVVDRLENIEKIRFAESFIRTGHRVFEIARLKRFGSGKNRAQR